jgi:predicted transcriptional regulator
MKKQFDFDKLNLADYKYVEDIFIDEEMCVKLNRLVDDLGFTGRFIFSKTEPKKEDPYPNLIEYTTTETVKPLLNINQEYNKIRDNFILNGVKYSDTIQYINLSQLREIDDSINFFEEPNDAEMMSLIQSIEVFSVIQPLLVIKDESGDNYKIVSGRSRFLASKMLFRNTGNEKYENLPCIILHESTNYSMIQGIIISENMSYRTQSRETSMKAMFLLDEIYRSSTMFRNGTSTASRIAKTIGVSRTTVNNYLELKHLSPLAMDLVVKKYMNLSVARVISSKDHETQDMIITGLKNNINDIEKVYEMMKGPSKVIYNKQTNSMIKDTWELKTARVNQMLPQYTLITLKVAINDVEEVFTGINDLRRAYARKYLTLKNNGLNKYFKVTFNDHDIQQYLKSGHLAQKTYDKLSTGVFNEIIKSA